MTAIPLASPFHFIVKYSGKYYLTQELWEFDPSMDTSGLDPDQLAWWKKIPTLYAGSPVKADGAVCVTNGQVCDASQINDGVGTAPRKA